VRAFSFFLIPFHIITIPIHSMSHYYQQQSLITSILHYFKAILPAILLFNEDEDREVYAETAEGQVTDGARFGGKKKNWLMIAGGVLTLVIIGGIYLLAVETRTSTIVPPTTPKPKPGPTPPTKRVSF